MCTYANSASEIKRILTNKQEVIVGGWGHIDCDECGSKDVPGVITWDHGEICNKCLKEKYIEVKQYSNK